MTNRKTPCIRRLAGLTSLALISSTAICATIGSPLINREFTDLDAGQVYIYNGTSSPFPAPGTLTAWSFFDNRDSGKSVTPLLFRITGAESFTLEGIGTTRVSAGTGLQSFLFGLIAGSADFGTGLFTFGFTDRRYSLSGNTVVAGTANTGVIPFDRPSATIPIDPWRETAIVTTPGVVTLQIGSVIGTGGVPFYNPIDGNGVNRIYSAQATEVPEPSALLLLSLGVLCFASTGRKSVPMPGESGSMPGEPELVPGESNHPRPASLPMPRPS